MVKGFIPTTLKEINDLKWKKADIIIVTGDAYVDHSSYMVATAARYLNNEGIKTAILDQPNIERDNDLTKLGRPDLFFLILSGEKDSMELNYSPYLKYKSTDPYLPGGKRNYRPDRATIQYTNRVKQLFKGVKTIIAGPEASNRRFSHYDFWSDKIRKPILFDSKADLLLFGHLEDNLARIARFLRSNKKGSLTEYAMGNKTNGIAYISKEIPELKHVSKNNMIQFSDHDSLTKKTDNAKRSFLEYTRAVYENSVSIQTALVIVQKVNNRYLVVNRPQRKLNEEEMDKIYGMNFLKRVHPKYKEEIPYFNLIKDTIVSHRGSFGGESFSTDVLNYGRDISNRSYDSIFREAHYIAKGKKFNNIFRNFFSASPNMYFLGGRKDKICNKCIEISCIHPQICPNLTVRDSNKRVSLMKKIDGIDGVRNNFYYGTNLDYRLLIEDNESFKDFIKERISSYAVMQIGSADDTVLERMNLRAFDNFENFYFDFLKRKGEYNKRNFELRVDLISGFPGESLNSVIDNVIKLNELEIKINRVFPFVPMPLTIASTIYYTGLDYESGRKIYVSNKLSEKEMQSTIYRFDKKPNRPKIKRVLRDLGRETDYEKIVVK